MREFQGMYKDKGGGRLGMNKAEGAGHQGMYKGECAGQEKEVRSRASVGRRLSGRTQVSAYFKK